MSDNKISMPSGQGGIVRYFDEYKSKIHFKPIWVLIAIVAVILIEMLLHARG